MGKKKGPIMEIGEFFWKILDGEPWAFSNTPPFMAVGRWVK